MKEQAEDRIVPVRIDHSIDEIWVGDHLAERYNFLDYHFERDGHYCRARSYADEFDSIVLYGPFPARHSIERIESPGFERDVVEYLERRFPDVSRR